MNDMQWKEEFNVGCDYVDKAHRKLFSVLRKVEDLLQGNDYEKNKFACVEAVKFLYDYTKTHFAQEEAFMREVGYKGYEMHKELHDNLREVTIPALDEELRKNDYSPEAVQQFVGVFTGWLTGHILVEDRAITGKVMSKWKRPGNMDALDALDTEMRQFIKEVSRMDVNLISKHFEGVSIENAFYYEMNYESTRIVFVAQNHLILKLVEEMTGVRQNGMGKSVLLTYIQFVQSLAKAVLLIAAPNEKFRVISHKAINGKELLGYFKEKYSEYSLQWKTDSGYLALCVMNA